MLVKEAVVAWLESHRDQLLVSLIAGLILAILGLLLRAGWRMVFGTGPAAPRRPQTPSIVREVRLRTAAQGKRLWSSLCRVLAKLRDRHWEFVNPHCLPNAYRPCGAAEKWAKRAAQDLEILRRPWLDMGDGSRFSGVHGGVVNGINRFWPDGSRAQVELGIEDDLVLHVAGPSPEVAHEFLTHDLSFRLSFVAPDYLADWTAAVDQRVTDTGVLCTVFLRSRRLVGGDEPPYIIRSRAT